MEQRDKDILDHVGLYRVSLRIVIERQFFAGRSSANVLKRLRDEGLLRSRSGLPGGLSYYQLSASGAALLGLPLSRARPLAPQALHANLALLWFCCLGRRARRRIEESALSALFDEELPQGYHCIEEGAPLRLYRVYAPGPHTKSRSVTRRLTEHLAAAWHKPTVRQWISLRQYAFAVLVETEGKRQSIERTVRGKARAGSDDLPLIEQAHVICETIPGLRTLKEAIHDYRSQCHDTE
jgi:hypothetical protein